MTRLARVFSLVLLLALLPGAGELVENAAHLVVAGHLAHAAPSGDTHDGSGGEHDCSGTLHVCSCCLTLAFVAVERAEASPPCVVFSLPGANPVPAGSPASDGLFRPPRA